MVHDLAQGRSTRPQDKEKEFWKAAGSGQWAYAEKDHSQDRAKRRQNIGIQVTKHETADPNEEWPAKYEWRKTFDAAFPSSHTERFATAEMCAVGDLAWTPIRSPCRMISVADKQQKGPAEVILLTPCTRRTSFVLGLVLAGLSIAAVLARFPTAYEWASDGSVVKSSRTVSDISGVATALAISGVALLAYAMNGVRLTKFGVGSVVAEGSSAVKSFREHPPSEADAKSVEVDAEEVEPTREPAAVLDDQMAVFELADVPSRVINDALAHWPADAGEPPSTLGAFEYASRRRGRGPYPWILKFAGHPEIRVFYGGRGKRDPTVRRNG